jgi:hypothetical protein
MRRTPSPLSSRGLRLEAALEHLAVSQSSKGGAFACFAGCQSDFIDKVVIGGQCWQAGQCGELRHRLGTEAADYAYRK